MHYYRQCVSAALLFWAPAISLSSVLLGVFPQISSRLISVILTLNSQGLSHHVLCCPNTFQMDIGSLASDTAVITSRGGNPLSVYLSYFHVERLAHHFGARRETLLQSDELAPSEASTQFLNKRKQKKDEIERDNM